jgi:hypothetical protein
MTSHVKGYAMATERAVDLWESARITSIFLDTKESKRQIPFEIEITL